MRLTRNGISILLTVVLCGSTTLAPTDASAEQRTLRARRVKGQLLVRPKAGVPPRALARAYARAGVMLKRRMRATRGQVIGLEAGDTVRVEKELRASGLFKSVERDHLAAVAAVPNDEYYSAQWGLPRSGVPAAWDLTTGDPSATVAVLDTGVDGSHPDLTGQLLPGYDFINDDADPDDDHGHGTRMSGIVAATWNNTQGVAGVAPSSRILPVKVLGSDGTGSYSAIADGITWAADQGASVISMSLAGDSPSEALQEAVNYATATGAVCIASAGNDGSSTPVYPAATNGVVAVAAIDQFDNKAWFSNTGAWISHAGPGVAVLTTDLGGGYSYSNGTSPAAAFSAGVFALLFAFEPGLSPANAIARVEQGAFDLGSQGWDPSFGWGGVDAMATLVPGEPGATPPDNTDPEVDLLSPTKGSLVSGLFGVEVAANDNVGISRVELFLDNRKHATEVDPPYSFIIDAATLEPGKHKLRAYAYDAAGNRENTKNIKVLTTTGSGLLVRKAKVIGGNARFTARFVLPEGDPFDPLNDSIVATVESAAGTVMSAVVTPADLEVSGTKTSALVNPITPTEGTVRFKTAAQGKGAEPSMYKIKIKATKLDPMLSLDDVMNLSLQIGGTQLSQGLNFRPKGSAGLVYP